MRWPPPFRSLSNPSAVCAWGMYDLANQSFQLLINSLLFPLFVTGVIVADDVNGRAIWFRMSAAGLLIVVLLSPLMGALADQRAWKREMLLISGSICAILTIALGFLQEGQLAMAFSMYLIAAVACGLGENFLGSFLPEISTPRNVGRVSGIGWTMSYIGALMLLGITAMYTLVFDRNDASQMRPMIVFSGIWFAIGMIPAVLWLHERSDGVQSTKSSSTIIGGAIKRLIASAHESKQYTQLVRFFISFGVYSAGTLTMIFGLGLIGDRLGFGLSKLILMGVVIALTAGVAAAFAGRFQDSFGHVKTISVFLVLWIVSTIAMASADLVHAPEIVYWIVAGLIGIAMGGVGTSSRAVVGAFTPQRRAGEFFGLWGMIYKLSGIAGVLIFGELSRVAGQPIALFVVAGLFTIGLALLWRVDESQGILQADHGESEAQNQPKPEVQ